ncbi:Nitrogen regulatory protein P-II-like protein [Mucuna pruriens]|uniref:Nitrogen regulatory protein P-II-like protein n=1 Tax=Mucuna pruriens TaxID=157652 RepID=A0A371FUT7_MUCPR|nr:Nitrogen regulatory protein P-II-like protein [Mucuna pruriens]
MAAIARTHVFSVVNFQFKETELPFACSSLIRKRFEDCPQRNVALRHRGNAAILPKIRAQNLPDYAPESKFYKVEAILSYVFILFDAIMLLNFLWNRPWRVPQVSSALLKMGIRGVTVSDVRGFGSQGGSKERQGGSEFSEDNFVAKVKVEIVVTKDQVEAVIDKVIEEARTGEIVIPVSDVIRIRTGNHFEYEFSGERGQQAEKMSGGRTDINMKKIKVQFGLYWARPVKMQPMQKSIFQSASFWTCEVG